MTNTLILKNSNISGLIPRYDELQLGELAINSADAKLFLKNNSNQVVDLTDLTNKLTNANKLLGRAINSTAPLDKQNLSWSSTLNAWKPTDVDAIKIQGISVDNSTPTTGQTLIYDGATLSWRAGAAPAGAGGFGDGSAASPSMYFSDNTNTGLYSRVNNELNVSLAGVERLRFDNTGINFTSTDSNFVAPPSFNSRTSGTRLVFYPSVSSTSTDYALGIDSGTLWYSIHQPTSSHFYKWYGGTTQLMTLRGDGNLGLNTGTPASKIHVVGGILASNSTSGTDPGAGNITATGTINTANAIISNNLTVTGTITNSTIDAAKIKGVPVDNSLIGDGKILAYDQAANTIKYITQSAGGGGTATGIVYSSTPSGKTNVALNKFVSISGWVAGGSIPLSLTNVVDGDENTSATEGVTFGSGNIGYVTVDLGSIYSGILNTKFGLRISVNSGTNSGTWRVETSIDGVNYDTVWSKVSYSPGNIEQVFYIYQLARARYIRYSATDIGQGQAALKVYETQLLVDNSSASAVFTGIRKVFEAELNGTTNVTIPNLNGDTDISYEVLLEGRATSTTASQITIRPNNDTNLSNYNRTSMHYFGGVNNIHGLDYVDLAGLLLMFCTNNETTTFISKATLKARSNNKRLSNTRSTKSYTFNSGGVNNTYGEHYTGLWFNTSSNITSLTVNFGTLTTFTGKLTIWATGGTTEVTNVAQLNKAQQYTATQGVDDVNVTWTPTIQLDGAASNTFNIPLGGTSTTLDFINLKKATYIINLIQQVGGSSVAYTSIFKFPGGVLPTLTTISGSVDTLTCVSNGSVLRCVISNDFR